MERHQVITTCDKSIITKLRNFGSCAIKVEERTQENLRKE